MGGSYFQANTFDDLLHCVIEELFKRGDKIEPSKGSAIEIRGVLLELTNPRARISRTETRGKIFSCLGELCWYLAKSNKLDFIQYYLPHYKEYADGNKIFGGYGPRFFYWKCLNQVANIIKLLKEKPDSRQAVIQLFDARDLQGKHNDIPCTCTLQFILRQNSLQLITYMRSNDVIWGLTHDIFCFTMLQEIISRCLSVEIGSYIHMVGSLHLYEKNYNDAKQYIGEGWQSTQISMPPMPIGDPWKEIKTLILAEKLLRKGKILDETIYNSLNPYWSDLIRLLQIFRYKKEKDNNGIFLIRSKLFNENYNIFIEKA
jgi:thymidylate synthase